MQYDALEYLPTSEELPDSDETPVDNELQDSVPGLLKAILADIWRLRGDWFFGIDLAVYYAPDEPAIAPDAFLSQGVRRFKFDLSCLKLLLIEKIGHKPRLSGRLWASGKRRG